MNFSPRYVIRLESNAQISKGVSASLFYTNTCLIINTYHSIDTANGFANSIYDLAKQLKNMKLKDGTDTHERSLGKTDLQLGSPFFQNDETSATGLSRIRNSRATAIIYHN